MRREVGRRNDRLTQEDRQKNLVWAVVGAKGERRMVKTTARDRNEYRSAPGRPAVTRTRPSESEEEDRPLMAGVGRGRRGSKRGERSDEEMEEEPPAKR